MRRITNHNLAQLLMQLDFTPESKRRKELEAAEKLYGLIDAGKQYPYDFVCFHITGYHPKESMNQALLDGADLRSDLELFIAKLSGKLACPIGELAEKVYTSEALAERFGVSVKTIGRWRKRGLLARKFIFDDGGHRFGFLESTVERFVADHGQLVGKARGFRRLSDKERLEIIRQARSLGSKTPLSRHRIIEHLSGQLGLAHETIRCLVQEHEKAHPGKPVFRRPSGRMKPSEAAELFRLYKQGVGVRQLMARFDRSRATIYRIVHQRRAIALLAKKIEFVPSRQFLDADAEERILAEPASIARGEPDKRIEPFELAGDSLLPEYLQVLKTTPILSRDQEIDLFRRYNFLKSLVAQQRHRIELANVSATLLARLEGYLEQAEDIRRMLVEANLRLVVSIANKHTADGTGFSELVSKGNFALIQAVEEFDYTRGFRFSRRASLNIAKEYARVSGRSTELTRKRAQSVANIQLGLRETATDVLAIERTRQSLAQVIREELDEREQYVILHHFGLLGSSIRKKTKTLKQIGEELDLTKERIRQIELLALQKLRQCLSKKQFELLMG